jgi:K+-transporting ATPase ATPase A chain
MLGLGYHMFTSAATGLAVGIAFIRGLTGRPLGNFYVDLIRSITRILLPISLIGVVVLIILGVPETLAGPVVVPTLENPGISQAIARGPVAHFEIIKELGENGGGFFAMNCAHPFENPNGASNLLEISSGCLRREPFPTQRLCPWPFGTCSIWLGSLLICRHLSTGAFLMSLMRETSRAI